MESLKGLLLLAAPTLGDPHFARSITLVMEHNESGAMGLTLNRALPVSVAEAWAKVSDLPCALDDALHLGGPVEGPLMLLHEDPKRSDDEVVAGVHFCAGAARVRPIMAHGPRLGRVRCFAGYAGWSAGQLEQELAEGSWVLVRGGARLIFDLDGAAQYQAAMALADPALGRLAANPKWVARDPGMN